MTFAYYRRLNQLSQTYRTLKSKPDYRAFVGQFAKVHLAILTWFLKQKQSL